jgi:RNA polymerase sigma factor (sigma-70 family)
MTTPSDNDVASLVRRAAAGDQSAWRDLVHRYSTLIWSVTRAHRLSLADAADAAQHTWTAFAEHLPTLRHPERVAGWLATTARRESLRILVLRGREVLADQLEDADPPEHGPEPQALRSARDRMLWRAFATLPERCRQLLGLLAHAPEMTYVQVSRALGIKVNSIGQTKGRCLAVLRRRFTSLNGGER